MQFAHTCRVKETAQDLADHPGIDKGDATNRDEKEDSHSVLRSIKGKHDGAHVECTKDIDPLQLALEPVVEPDQKVLETRGFLLGGGGFRGSGGGPALGGEFPFKAFLLVRCVLFQGSFLVNRGKRLHALSSRDRQVPRQLAIPKAGNGVSMAPQ